MKCVLEAFHNQHKSTTNTEKLLYEVSLTNFVLERLNPVFVIIIQN
jgi:hypothetical protein